MATLLPFFSRQIAPSDEQVTRPFSQSCCGWWVLYSKSALCLFAQMMEDTQSDFTMTFRQLSELSAQQLQKRNFEQVKPMRFSSFFSSAGLLVEIWQWFLCQDWSEEDKNYEWLWDGQYVKEDQWDMMMCAFPLRPGLWKTCPPINSSPIGSAHSCVGLDGNDGLSVSVLLYFIMMDFNLSSFWSHLVRQHQDCDFSRQQRMRSECSNLHAAVGLKELT